MSEMNIDSLITKLLATRLQAWIFLAFSIVFMLAGRRMFGLFYSRIRPIIEPSKGQKKVKEACLVRVYHQLQLQSCVIRCSGR